MEEKSYEGDVKKEFKNLEPRKTWDLNNVFEPAVGLGVLGGLYLLARSYFGSKLGIDIGNMPLYQQQIAEGVDFLARFSAYIGLISAAPLALSYRPNNEQESEVAKKPDNLTDLLD